ncbi:MAG: hypothetical protein HUJ75_05285, partial [Parasporobacterium sp.]|nr:hypothetical protein [Parasporobacterium sp.]
MKKKVFLTLSLILSAVLLLTACGGGNSEPETEVKETTAYIASDGGFVNVYGFEETADDDSEPLFGINFYINRGTEVTELDRYYEEHFKDENDEPYTIKYTEIRTSDGKSGYVLPENLVQDKSLIMQETEKYVRTPVTVYENADTPDIAGFIPKGSRVELTGFRNVDSEGVIDMYKVSYEGLEGYVYGKYLAVDSVSADTVYYQDGIYDIHKDRTFRYDLWGGEAKDLDYFPYERTELDHPMLKEAKAMYLNCEAAVNNSGYLEIA